jgi:predicted 3-demethylubiquinone-9 3-methyltransferase (glyoxalase superfamily)
MTIRSITPFLWFDTQAEDAAKFYVSLFPNSKITHVARYGDAGPGPKGSVMIVAFELMGHPFYALNGGQTFKLDEAFSLYVACTEQDEIDRFWDALSEGGTPNVCGWTKDKFGVSWQVNYADIADLLTGPNADKVMTAQMKMKKPDIQALKDAAA